MTYVGAAAERALIAIDFEQQVHYDISGLSQRSAVSPKENWNRHPARRGWAGLSWVIAISPEKDLIARGQKK